MTEASPTPRRRIVRGLRWRARRLVKGNSADRARLDQLRRQHDALRDRCERQAQQLAKQADALDALNKRVDAMKERALPFERAANRRLVEHGRVSVQVGVLEERLGRLEEQLSTGPLCADDEGLSEARSVLDAVRREHEQVRARMQLISHYEERLRRVEAAVESLDDEDVRRFV